jgi:hypothetical protein
LTNVRKEEKKKLANSNSSGQLYNFLMSRQTKPGVPRQQAVSRSFSTDLPKKVDAQRLSRQEVNKSMEVLSLSSSTREKSKKEVLDTLVEKKNLSGLQGLSDCNLSFNNSFNTSVQIVSTKDNKSSIAEKARKIEMEMRESVMSLEKYETTKNSYESRERLLKIYEH